MDEGRAEAKEYWRQAGLLALGAVMGAVPVLISTRLQARAQIEQLVIDRRIAVIRDYSKACVSIVATVQRSLDEVEAADEGDAGAQKSVDKLIDFLHETRIEAVAQRRLADSLFPVRLPPPAEFKTPRSKAEALKIAAALDKQCRDDVELLTSRLFR